MREWVSPRAPHCSRLDSISFRQGLRLAAITRCATTAAETPAMCAAQVVGSYYFKDPVGALLVSLSFIFSHQLLHHLKTCFRATPELNFFVKPAEYHRDPPHNTFEMAYATEYGDVEKNGGFVKDQAASDHSDEKRAGSLGHENGAVPGESFEVGNSWYAKIQRVAGKLHVEQRGIERVPEDERTEHGFRALLNVATMVCLEICGSKALN